MFVDQWLETNRLRIQPNNLSQKDLEAYTSIMDDDFIGCGVDYLLRLAAAIFKEQDGKPVVQYIHRHDKDSWKAEFFGNESEAKLLRDASPLMRTGNQYRFVHRSVLEYLLSRVIYNPVEVAEEDMDHESETASSSLSHRQTPTVPCSRRTCLRAIDHPVSVRSGQTIPDFEQQLRAVIDLSKTDPSAAIAATNAITILVRAGVAFHNADLRGVKIAWCRPFRWSVRPCAVPRSRLDGGQSFEELVAEGEYERRTDGWCPIWGTPVPGVG